MTAHEVDAAQQTDALTARLKRTELQHEPSSIPGREIVQVLTEVPVGVESGWHELSTYIVEIGEPVSTFVD